MSDVGCKSINYGKRTQELVPMSFLANSLNTGGIKIMAEKIISDELKNYKLKHGMCGTVIYNTWVCMIQRCENPNNPNYKDYGARGISVCERWHSFESFYEDVGNPSKGMTLDRWPDNDGNYEPNNWKWSTRKQQSKNKRPISYGLAKQYWFIGINIKTGKRKISNNQREFARIYDLQDAHISDCLHGKQKTHKGWKFKRIEDSA